MSSSINEVVASALAFLPSEEPLLVAVSGGADSVALLHLLLSLNYRHLTVCHFNHQLRGASSDDDANFVQKLAKILQLSFVLGSEDVAERARRDQCSLETAAREARYAFFATVAEKNNISTLLLAHHADDQIETCLFHYLRGAGAAGLAGMLPIARRSIAGKELLLVRPLLSISKNQLKNYLATHAISFCHDESNESLLPMRNRLRHRLLPLLDEIFGTTYRNAILRTATILSAEEEFLESLVAPVAMESTLNIEKIRLQPLALRRRIIYQWLKHHDFCDIGFYEVERVASLLDEKNPRKINLPLNRHAFRHKGEIYLE